MGLQGGLLAGYIDAPLRLASMTVGGLLPDEMGGEACPGFLFSHRTMVGTTVEVVHNKTAKGYFNA